MGKAVNSHLTTRCRSGGTEGALNHVWQLSAGIGNPIKGKKCRSLRRSLSERGRLATRAGGVFGRRICYSKSYENFILPAVGAAPKRHAAWSIGLGRRRRRCFG